jgi:hypothetical protein
MSKCNIWVSDFCAHYSIHAVVVLPKYARLMHNHERIGFRHIKFGQGRRCTHYCIDNNIFFLITHFFTMIYCWSNIIFVNSSSREVHALVNRHSRRYPAESNRSFKDLYKNGSRVFFVKTCKCSWKYVCDSEVYMLDWFPISKPTFDVFV